MEAKRLGECTVYFVEFRESPNYYIVRDAPVQVQDLFGLPDVYYNTREKAFKMHCFDSWCTGEEIEEVTEDEVATAYENFDFHGTYREMVESLQEAIDNNELSEDGLCASQLRYFQSQYATLTN